jgi:superfamily II helicase
MKFYVKVKRKKDVQRLFKIFQDLVTCRCRLTESAGKRRSRHLVRTMSDRRSDRMITRGSVFKYLKHDVSMVECVQISTDTQI